MSAINYLLYKTNAPTNWKSLTRYIKINNVSRPDLKLGSKVPEFKNKSSCWELGYQIDKSDDQIIFQTYVFVDATVIYNHKSLHTLDGKLINLYVYYTETMFDESMDYSYLITLINGMLQTKNLDSFWNKVETFDENTDLPLCQSVVVKMKTKAVEQTIKYDEIDKILNTTDVQVYYVNYLTQFGYNVYVFRSRNLNDDTKEINYNKMASSFIKDEQYGDVIFMAENNIMSLNELLKIMKSMQQFDKDRYRTNRDKQLRELFEKAGMTVQFVDL